MKFNIFSLKKWLVGTVGFGLLLGLSEFQVFRLVSSPSPRLPVLVPSRQPVYLETIVKNGHSFHKIVVENQYDESAFWENSKNLIKVWYLDGQALLRVFPGDKTPISDVAITPDGDSLVSARLGGQYSFGS